MKTIDCVWCSICCFFCNVLLSAEETQEEVMRVKILNAKFVIMRDKKKLCLM